MQGTCELFESIVEEENLYRNYSRQELKLILRYHSHAIFGIFRTGHRRIRRIWIWSYTKSIWLWWERMLQKMSFCAEKCSCLFVTVLFLRLLTLKQFWKWNWRRRRPTGNRIQRPDANTWRELNKRSNGQGVSLHFARFVYTRWNFGYRHFLLLVLE